MTLAEVMVSLAILAVALGGLLSGLLQTRRLTEGTLDQTMLLNVVYGYLEQMRQMNLGQLINDPTNAGGLTVTPHLNVSYAIPTVSSTAAADGSLATDTLYTSVGLPPALPGLVPGVTPNGVTDNLRDVPRGASGAKSAPAAWSAVWPGALTHPSSGCHAGDLHLNLWVWITDLSETASPRTLGPDQVYGITLIYTWQQQDGGRTSYHLGCVHAIRTAVSL